MNNPYGFPLNHLHLELSSKCFLKCIRCPRTEYPETPWIGRELSLDQIQKALTDELLKQKVQRITICGDVGDPIYNSEFIEIVDYFKKCNPSLSLYIITNGSYKSEDWWHRLVTKLNQNDTIAFSIDGHDAVTNQKYRVNSDWPSIEKAMAIVEKSNVCMVWAAIVFEFNQNDLDQIRNLAIERGCDFFQLTKSTKFGSKYKSYQDHDGKDFLEPDEKWISSSHRFERQIEKLSDKDFPFIDSFLKTSQNEFDSLKSKDVFGHIRPLCLTGNRGSYINVTGQFFPCSWVSFPYNKLVSEDRRREVLFKDSFFHAHAESLNILKHDFQDVLNSPLWETLFKRMVQSRPFIECEQKCHKKHVVQDYAVGWFLN